MDLKNYTNARLYQVIEETEDHAEMGEAFKELMKRSSDDELVKSIEDMAYIEAVPYALDELMERSSSKAFDMGMDILINDKGDHFLQACVWSTCYDHDDIRTVTLMAERKTAMGYSLTETILLSMYDHETDQIPPAFKKLIIDSYNDMPEEKKADLSEMFDYFTKKYQT